MGSGKRTGLGGIGGPDLASLGTGLFTAVVFGATLAVGGVHIVTVCVLALAAAVSLLLLAKAGPLRTSQGVWVFVGLAAFTFVQTLPLPVGVGELIAPSLAEAWTQAARLGEYAPRVSLTLDPGATRAEVLKLLLYAAGWLIAFQYAQREGARACVRACFLLSLVLLAASLGHRLAGAESVYGIYQPSYFSVRPSPLLNSNNEAGLLNLGVFCGLGLFLSSKRSWGAAGLSLLGVVLLIGGSILTGSRGGALSLLFGVALTAGLLWHRSRRRRGRGEYRPLAVLGGVMVLGVAAYLLAANRQDKTALWDQSLEKLYRTSWAWEVVASHPLTGAGRGALGSALTRARSEASSSVAEYAESWPLEFLAGWGLVVGSVATAFLVFSLLPRRLLRKTSNLHLPVYVGLLVVATQNLADLAFELPGVALPTVVLLATLWGARHNEGRPPAEDRRSAVLLAVLLTIGGGLLLAFPQQRTRDVRRELAVESRQKTLKLSKLQGVLRSHPADAYIFRLGALAAYREQRGYPLKWLNSSLNRDPYDGRSYLLMAQLVAERGGTRHALLALRQAASLQPELSGEAANMALRLSPARVASAVPEGLSGVPMLLKLSERATDPEARLRWASAALERSPDQPEAHMLQARAWLLAVQNSRPPCVNSRACLADARAALSRARQRNALRLDWLPLHAWHLALAGQRREAYELLLTECPRREKHRACLRTLLSIAVPLSDTDFRRAAEAFLDGSCGRARGCVAAQSKIAAMYEKRGDLGAALALRRGLAQLNGSAQSWFALSEVAQRLGRTQEARRALRRFREKQAQAGE